MRYERDGAGTWNASAKSLRGCSAQASTLAEAERQIREQLGRFVDDPATVSLERDCALPTPIKASVREAVKLRKRVEEAQMKEQQVLRAAVMQLRQDLGLGAEDTGALLGIPEERVKQLEESNAPPL